MKLYAHKQTGALYQANGIAPSTCTPVLGFQAPRRRIPFFVVGEPLEAPYFNPDDTGLRIMSIDDDDEPLKVSKRLLTE